MSQYTPGSGDRAAFFAALGRVFQEFQEASKGYAVCEIDRLATVSVMPQPPCADAGAASGNR